jgi:hypothetical protein
MAANTHQRFMWLKTALLETHLTIASSVEENEELVGIRLHLPIMLPPLGLI